MPTRIALLVVVGMAVPLEAAGQNCSLYNKWLRDHSVTVDCASQSYFEVTPLTSPGTSTFFARKVPKCMSGTEACAAPEVRSLDGTRAFYYVDPGSLTGVNAWVIALEGGGSCGAMRGDNAAEACMNGTNADYGFNGYSVTNIANDLDYTEMTTRHPQLELVGGAPPQGTPIYTIRDRRPGRGILDPSGPNLFATWNRVIVNKSSFDRFMGNQTTTAPYNGDTVELYFHGRRILSAMLKDLDRINGTISVGPSCPSTDPSQCETLSDFSAATHVVVVGHSGGAGGIIHNMEWLKSAILSRAPNAKVTFLLGSRMIPWLEAEAHWTTTGDELWDGRYSGSSTVEGDVGTADAPTQYSPTTFQNGGTVRSLLLSWGNPNSVADPFLDASCKAHHGNGDWRCFDEGHVALHHTDEDVFWFESLNDSVHNNSSPAPYIDSADFGAGFVSLADQGGFRFNDPPNGPAFTVARGARVIYTVDQVMQQHPGAGSMAFYIPLRDCHSTVFTNAFWNDVMVKNGGNPHTLSHAFFEWMIDVASGTPQDRAWVEDGQSPETMSWSDGLFGGGWTSPGPCSQ